MNEKIEKKDESFVGPKISRKQAIKKTGLMAASAATMMVLLKTPKAQACSTTAFKKSASSTPSPQRSGGNSGPWGNNNGHQNQNGLGHTNHNGNGNGHSDD